MRAPRPLRRRGRKPSPVGRFTFDTHHGIRASGVTITAIAEVCGWTRVQLFSPLLHDDFPLTPTTLARLKKLGALLGLPADRVYEEAR